MTTYIPAFINRQSSYNYESIHHHMYNLHVFVFKKAKKI